MMTTAVALRYYLLGFDTKLVLATIHPFDNYVTTTLFST
jgi:hypothetical protein